MGAMKANSKPEEMNVVALSYLGRPVYLLASFVWAFFARVVAWFVTNAKRNTGAGEIKVINKASPRPREPLVRLKNLPQVCEREFFVLGAGLASLLFGPLALTASSSTAHVVVSGCVLMRRVV